MPFLAIEGGRLHYEVQGSGYPLLLFAPGFLSSRIERWRTNPAKPGVPQDWLDPIRALSDRFTTIALDVRNAGESRATLGPGDDWSTYTVDHVALLDHLGVTRCHAMGACIGVSFAYALAAARPGLVTAMVLQNPIGLSSANRAALDAEFAKWAAEVRSWPGIDAAELPGFHRRMFGGEFIFSVSREFVARCAIPSLLMPGDDLVHPTETSTDIARAPNVEVLAPWKGVARREGAMRRVGEFLMQHTETKR
jgi:pimeloyl-ACP methyl ester carboxylesterase